jgi:hypothetical protein
MKVTYILERGGVEVSKTIEAENDEDPTLVAMRDLRETHPHEAQLLSTVMPRDIRETLRHEARISRSENWLRRLVRRFL